MLAFIISASFLLMGSPKRICPCFKSSEPMNITFCSKRYDYIKDLGKKRLVWMIQVAPRTITSTYTTDKQREFRADTQDRGNMEIEMQLEVKEY